MLTRSSFPVIISLFAFLFVAQYLYCSLCFICFAVLHCNLLIATSRRWGTGNIHVKTGIRNPCALTFPLRPFLRDFLPSAPTQEGTCSVSCQAVTHCPPPPALREGCHNGNKEVDLPAAVQQALRVALASHPVVLTSHKGG